MADVPRDEIVPWLEDEEEKEEEEEVIDLAEMYVDALIDAGITSSGDPSNWDPIEVERDK